MRLYLRILSGLQIGDEVTISPPGGVIGRSEESAICIRDASVSRAHLELHWQDRRWWAQQRSTRSATVIDGQVAQDRPLPLLPSGTIQVGNVTLEYHEQETAQTETPNIHPSPPTMINIRPQLSAIQHAVQTQLQPMRPPEPPPSQAPATLILRRPDPLITAPPIPAADPLPVQPLDDGTELATLRLEVERWRQEAERLRQKTVEFQQALAEAQRQLAEQRREQEALQGEVARLRAERGAEPPQSESAEHRAVALALPAQALALLTPFSASLEGACDALRDGDAARARSLIRDASFGLADLRDLFETAA